MILVTGASGHTGHRLVHALLERGEKVRVLTREPAGMLLELRRKVSVFRGSLDNEQDRRDAAEGCDAVIAMTHIRLAPLVIEMMRSGGIRRGIFMSSTRRFTKFPETTARQVIEGEEAVRNSALDWTIIRPTMIYGSYHDNNLVHVVRWLRRLPVVPLPGRGEMLFQPVFTWDVVAALVAAYEHPEKAIGHEYNIAGPDPISLRTMFETIRKGLGRSVMFVPVPMRLVEIATRFYGKLSSHPRLRLDQIQRLKEDKNVDISDAQRDLGFSPISFDEGIRRKLAGEV